MVDKCTSGTAYVSYATLFIWGIALTICSIIVFLNDDDGAVVAINAFNALGGLTFLAASLAGFFIERKNLAQCRVSAEEELAERKEAAQKQH